MIKWHFSLPDGMSQADGTPVDVDPCGVDIQHFDVGQNDNAEGFVDLPQSNVFCTYLSIKAMKI